MVSARAYHGASCDMTRRSASFFDWIRRCRGAVLAPDVVDVRCGGFDGQLADADPSRLTKASKARVRRTVEDVGGASRRATARSTIRWRAIHATNGAIGRRHRSSGAHRSARSSCRTGRWRDQRRSSRRQLASRARLLHDGGQESSETTLSIGRVGADDLIGAGWPARALSRAPARRTRYNVRGTRSKPAGAPKTNSAFSVHGVGHGRRCRSTTPPTPRPVREGEPCLFRGQNWCSQPLSEST